jgi:hypothetical protein
MHLGVWLEGMLTHPESVTPKQQLKCCSCGGNHTANYRGCSKWKEAKAAVGKRAQIEIGRGDGVSTRLHTPKSAPTMRTPNSRHLGLAGTTLSKGAVFSKVTLLTLRTPPHPISTGGPSGRLSTRTAPVSTLVLRRRWRNPYHTAPNMLTRHTFLTVRHLLRV